MGWTESKRNGRLQLGLSGSTRQMVLSHRNALLIYPVDAFLASIRNSVVELINKDYADFVSLSSNLVWAAPRLHLPTLIPLPHPPFPLSL